MCRPGILLLLAAVAGGCRPTPSPVVTSLVRQQPAEVEVAAHQMERRNEIAGLALAHINSTVAELDPDKPGSDLNKLNRVANSVRLQISRNTFRLIDLAHHYSERTGGAYDLTAAPLETLWGVNGAPAPAEEPPAELIRGVMKGVGRHHVEIFDQGSVAFTSPGTQIGLDRIGQAYAVDLAILELRRRAISDVRIQVAGYHRILGDRGRGVPWRALLPHPFLAGTNLASIRLAPPLPALAVLELHKQTLTMGTQTYSTILDPRTGRPAQGTALAAVLAPSATMASALAQALLVAGVEQAPALLAQFPKCEALLVPDQQPAELWRTEGFAECMLVDAAVAWPTVDLRAAPASVPDAAGSRPATGSD